MSSFIDILRQEFMPLPPAPTSFPANESPSQFDARQQASGYNLTSAKGGIVPSEVQPTDLLTIGQAAVKGPELLHRLATKGGAAYEAFTHAPSLAHAFRSLAEASGSAERAAAERLARGVEADNPFLSRLGSAGRAFMSRNPQPLQKDQWLQSLAQDVAQTAKASKNARTEQLLQQIQNTPSYSPVASKVLDFAEKTVPNGKR